MNKVYLNLTGHYWKVGRLNVLRQILMLQNHWCTMLVRTVWCRPLLFTCISWNLLVLKFWSLLHDFLVCKYFFQQQNIAQQGIHSKISCRRSYILKGIKCIHNIDKHVLLWIWSWWWWWVTMMYIQGIIVNSQSELENTVKIIVAKYINGNFAKVET